MKPTLSAGLVLVATLSLVHTAHAQAPAQAIAAGPAVDDGARAAVINVGMTAKRRSARRLRRLRRQAGPQRVRGLNSGGRRPTANTGASLYALGVYLQWRRKCLDAMLPPPDC